MRNILYSGTDIKKRRVAVIGIGCRYAGADNPRALWQLLIQKKAVNAPMERRFPEWMQYYHPHKGALGKFYNERAFFLSEDIEDFDADFFHISYKEAKRMDYQQRMLLMVSYEALLDAGIEIQGSNTGVFIGAFMQDFLINIMQRDNRGNLDGFHATGSSIGMLANRLSYFYDTHGPSMAVDTACSSSLTALHLATESIRSGSCQTALCGGVNIITDLGNFISLSKGGFLSQRSSSSAFGEAADGYARGEGIGVLVLKDWEQAVRDGDRIYCEIVRTAINHDGNKQGVSYPNGEAQKKLLNKIYGEQGIPIDALGYLEAHGTGTQAGDRTECESMQAIFANRKKTLYIGSLKTNIGHTEAAAGIASVIKGILIMQNGEIPPTIECTQKNPNIPFEDYRVCPVESIQPMEAAEDGRYYVGVSGFGFGGSNAHVVLGSTQKQEEEMAHTADGDISKIEDPAGSSSESDNREEERHVLCLCANGIRSLQLLANKYCYELQGGDLKDYSLEEICGCILQRRPQQLPYRLALNGRNRQELVRKLKDFVDNVHGGDWNYKYKSKPCRKTVAVFSGMGIQREDMGRELYRDFKVFRDTFRKCSSEYEKHSGKSLTKIIEGETSEGFYRVGFLQSYNLAYQISLFRLLQEKGIKFLACVGHSAGELAAFYCSGFLSLEETFRIAWHRGRCQEKQQGKGKMLALTIERGYAEELCKKYENKISLGVQNGSNQMVLSGDRQILEEIQNLHNGTFLHGSVAYHSSQMDAISEELLESVGMSEAKTMQIPLYSTVSGKKMEAQDYDGSYWWRNVRQTVEFYRVLKTLRKDGYDAFMEIGTTPVLSHYIAAQSVNRDFTYITVQTRKGEGSETKKLYQGLQQAYVNRIPMAEKAGGKTYRHLPLPLYPWDNKKLPVEITKQPQEVGDFLGEPSVLPWEIWKKQLNTVSQPWLLGHLVEGERYLPAVFYIAVLAEAGIRRMENLVIQAPVIIPSATDVIIALKRDMDGKAEAAQTLAGNSQWKTVLQVENVAEAEKIQGKEAEKEKTKEIKKFGLHIEKPAVYYVLQEKGLTYEGCFQSIGEAWVQRKMKGESEICAKLQLDASIEHSGRILGILDGMLQAAALAESKTMEEDNRILLLPVKIGNVQIYDTEYAKCQGLWVYAKVQKKGHRADCYLCNTEGKVLVEFGQVHFGERQRIDAKEGAIYGEEWEEITVGKENSIHAELPEKPLLYMAGKEVNAMSLLEVIRKEEIQRRGLIVVTENAKKVLSEDKVCGYEQAALWGLIRCIRLEQPEKRLWLLDTDDVTYVRKQLERAEFLISEREDELASRNGKWYGLRIQKRRENSGYEEEGGKQNTTACFRGKGRSGTAILTGGSGGLAFYYALHLAAAGCQAIVLIARRETKQMQILKQVLEYYGKEFRYFQADVTDARQLEDAYEKIKSAYPQGRAVYHLAGYQKDCACGEITTELWEQHMAPKIIGAKHLSRLVKENADQLVLIGSVSALLGNAGQGCYAAANELLQSFGEYAGHTLAGFGALDTGMAVRSEAVQRALAMQGIDIMNPRLALQCMRNSEMISYVAALDWELLAKRRNLRNKHKFLSVLKENEGSDSFRRRYAQASKEERIALLEELLRDIYTKVLDVEGEGVSLERNTDTMGIDSLGATFIAGSIKQELGDEIVLPMVSGAFTLRDLAIRLELERETEEETDQ